MATSDQYLKAIDGITTSSTIGYRMIRAGSITGISIQTNVTFFIDPGNIAFEVRKAGSNVFSTSLAVSSGGIKGTQSTQARGVDTFTAGQIISVYANFDPSVIATLDNTIVIVEIITD